MFYCVNEHIIYDHLPVKFTNRCANGEPNDLDWSKVYVSFIVQKLNKS